MSERLLQAAPKRGLTLPPLPHDPATLGRLAAQMFVRPQRSGRRMPREQAYLASSRSVRLTSFSGELAAWEWGPATGSLVVLVHGWEGHGAQLGAFITPLVEAGFRVLAFDAPGHGDSPGEECHVPLLARTLGEAKRQLGPFFALIGHSMGAAAAAMAATLEPKPLGLVLLAPPLSQLDRVQRVASRLQLDAATTEAFVTEVERRTETPYAEADMLAVARQAPCPLLVFHDPVDEDTSFSEAERIVAAWSGARLVPCPGRGHYRILATAEIIQQTVAFLTSRR